MSRCTHCGFDNNGPTNNGKCAGCGVQIRPHPDHEKPAPGFAVYPEGDDDPNRRDAFGGYVVTDADREAYPELEGVIRIEKLNFEYGHGIGAEPYGYHTRERIETVDLREWGTDSGASGPLSIRPLTDATECPECGGSRARHRFVQDAAGVAGGESLNCETCDYEFADEFWA